MTADALRLLVGDRARPVWSLIVTLMGDATRDDGGALPGAWLREVLGRLGASSAAVRTATHRLRADGWIVTERDGRASAHRLTARALAETRAVAARIYGPGPAGPERWSLVMAEAAPPGAVTVAPGLHLRAGPLGGDAGVSGPDLRLPGEAARGLWSGALRSDCRDLRRRLKALRPPDAPLPADAAALRTVIVHDWRRIVLRAPPLPDALAPRDWDGAATRRAVHAALERLAVRAAAVRPGPRAGGGGSS